MPIQSKKEPQYQARPADIAVARTEKKMGAMSIIAKSQIKVWKAMLFSLFFAGFVGALAWAIAFDNADRLQQSEAAGGVIIAEINLAPSAEIAAPSYAEGGSEGWKLLVDNDLSPDSVMVRNSRGSVVPYADFIFPGSGIEGVRQIAIAVNPVDARYRTCGLAEFTVETSEDGQTFIEALKGTKANTPGFEEYPLGNVRAKVIRLHLDRNHGDEYFTCVQEVKILR